MTRASTMKIATAGAKASAKRLAKSIDDDLFRQIVRDHLSKAGAIGGARTSQAKARAARKNGKKGGRPKDQTIHGIYCQNCVHATSHAYNFRDNSYICMGCGAQNDR